MLPTQYEVGMAINFLDENGKESRWYVENVVTVHREGRSGAMITFIPELEKLKRQDFEETEKLTTTAQTQSGVQDFDLSRFTTEIPAQWP